MLIAQLVNFTVVVLVLWFFALKPLIKTMNNRSNEIAKGLDDAKEAADRLVKVEEDVKAKLNKTKVEAAKILEQAREQAEEGKQANMEKTKAELENLIKKAKQQIASEKDKMVSQAKDELAGVVVSSLEKILSSGLSKDLDKKYIDKVLKELK